MLLPSSDPYPRADTTASGLVASTPLLAIAVFPGVGRQLTWCVLSALGWTWRDRRCLEATEGLKCYTFVTLRAVTWQGAERKSWGNRAGSWLFTHFTLQLHLSGHFLRLKASLLCWSQVGLDSSQGELSTFAAHVRGNTIPIEVNFLAYVAKVIRGPLVPRMPRPWKGHTMIYDYRIQKTNVIS